MEINKNILEFSKFLDYFKEKYGKPSYEISIPKPEDKYESNVKLVPLVSSDYIMLDFDSMCADANFYPKKNKDVCNRPSTVDALYYRIINDSKIQFFLVEFKSIYFHWDSYGDYYSSLKKIIRNLSCININDEFTLGINRLNAIRNTYGSSIEFSLRLKPYESLFVVLPKIYEEYCNKKFIDKTDRLDLYDFFKGDTCEICLIIVGKSSDNSPVDYLGNLGNLLNKQYKRLEFVDVLTKHKLFLDNEFDKVTNQFKKDENKTLKSLNYSK